MASVASSCALVPAPPASLGQEEEPSRGLSPGPGRPAGQVAVPALRAPHCQHSARGLGLPHPNPRGSSRAVAEACTESHEASWRKQAGPQGAPQLPAGLGAHS